MNRGTIPGTSSSVTRNGWISKTQKSEVRISTVNYRVNKIICINNPKLVGDNELAIIMKRAEGLVFLYL